jgi:von Willebrand factor type A domain
MRKGLRFFAPLALVAGLHMACSTVERRNGFGPDSDLDAGSGRAFDPIDAGKSDARGCSESQTEIARVPVVIEFVVDESGSMDGTGVNDKWAAARDALLAAFEDMQSTADPATFIGALRFGSAVGNKVAPGPLTDASHYDDLVALIDTSEAGGGSTKTETALKAAYGIVEKFKPPASSGLVADQMNRVVVLLSDGSPDGGGQEQAACEALAEEKLTENPPKGPILTFAVGIGPFPSTSSFTYDPAFMGRLAQQGGTAPADCDPASQDLASVCHFQVTPGGDLDATKQALIDAINTIRALSASCEFSFTRNESTDLKKVEVVITDKDGNQTKIPKDPENGWAFDDPENPTKIVLHGEACSASNGAVSGRVDVVIGCRSAN